MKQVTTWLAVAVALVSAIGCIDESLDGSRGGGSGGKGDHIGEGGDAGPAPGGGVVDGGAATKSFRGSVRDLNGGPLESATVCVENVAGVPCDVTDAEGNWLIEDLPAGMALKTVTTKQGFAPGNKWIQDVPEWPSYQYWTTLLELGIANVFAQLIAGAVDPTKGAISFNAYVMSDGVFPSDGFDALRPMTQLAGVSIELAPGSGVRAYLNAGGLPDVNLTETTSRGVGAYAGVEPGVYDISTVFPAGFECNHDGLVPGDDVKVEVRAGHMTGVWLRCVPSP
jgi:hypothetical protein